MKTLTLPSELRSLFESRVAAYNRAHALPVADESFACYVDGALCVHLFSTDLETGELVEVVAHSSSAPFAVALDAALARFAFAG